MYYRQRKAWLCVLGATAGALWGTPGCDSTAARRRALASGNPLDRARAVVQVAEGRDPDAVHKLVDLLDDPDKTVRMYAIIALKRLCGQDYGFRYYADETERRAAVQRWRQALRTGEVTLVPRTRPAGVQGSTSELDGRTAARLGVKQSHDQYPERQRRAKLTPAANEGRRP
ncbi:MAG: HEAT repeat domain-containing protein [Phycisphaerae bacterium]|nr:HEAT repeat domain-containing protein [Phycisphaerae bacterium]